MRTNIEIDDQLMREAMDATGARTKKETVENALRTTVQLKKQERILELRGIGWIGDLDEMRRDS